MKTLRSIAPIVLIILLSVTACLQAQESGADKRDSETPHSTEPVRYVGTDQCIDCHKSQHESYLRTLHSKAAQFTDVKLEPKPASFLHELSGHRYAVEVTNAEMIHLEKRQDKQGKPLGETRHAMSNTIGSGAHSKSYLTRIGDFHTESPITYYSDSNTWAMSPGYDLPSHRSFRREVTVGCVFCHVGSIKQFENNPYKFEIVEPTIGCERCHGPGELHVKRKRADTIALSDPPKKVPGDFVPDDFIVNPSKLSRQVSEAICQQCHCQGAQEVEVSHKDTWDFRPGKRLTDYRVDFQFRTENGDAMSLVGHVEQLHQSKCYTATETLTCTTCHDPHDQPSEGKSVEYHRSKCVQCHQNDSCGQPISERNAQNGNDCAKCHMPRGETDVAHFALHNHRIGIHSKQDLPSPEILSDVEPILDISHLPSFEQLRLKGLVKYQLFRQRGGDAKFASLQMAATSELIQVKQLGKADADVNAALVWLAWEQGQTDIAEKLAREVLALESESDANVVASHVLARILFNRGEYAAAISLYQSLERQHRDPSDSYFLGLAEQNAGNSENAIAALKRSIEIDPTQHSARRALHAIYQSLGRMDDAAEQRRLAEAYEER